MNNNIINYNYFCRESISTRVQLMVENGQFISVHNARANDS